VHVSRCLCREPVTMMITRTNVIKKKMMLIKRQTSIDKSKKSSNLREEKLHWLQVTALSSTPLVSYTH
jgi:hypothetical protein